eukprot:CAMPEP_0181329580 /NCGR_PEP_ID=MMETSP1101-20121128/23385_1 /TAXON_ID=46948 /ORGANISM="Rhodomonas abbreviata, Strain Caron Lab Isolate" /LENGTH=203 /DNA_ID=CAMNT_0023438665 /DNA_START=339 /DNA_END=946 /DNA_ORIENTATION=+
MSLILGFAHSVGEEGAITSHYSFLLESESPRHRSLLTPSPGIQASKFLSNTEPCQASPARPQLFPAACRTILAQRCSDMWSMPFAPRRMLPARCCSREPPGGWTAPLSLEPPCFPPYLAHETSLELSPTPSFPSALPRTSGRLPSTFPTASAAATSVGLDCSDGRQSGTHPIPHSKGIDRELADSAMSAPTPRSRLGGGTQHA